jgi:YD repeat-containing protein
MSRNLNRRHLLLGLLAGLLAPWWRRLAAALTGRPPTTPAPAPPVPSGSDLPGCADRVTVYCYDASGRLTCIRDGGGRITTYVYDDRGGPADERPPAS